MKILLLSILLIFNCLLFAQDSNAPVKHNPRQYINVENCNIFFTPFEPLAAISFDDGSALKLAKANLDKNFKQEALKLYKEHGEEYFYKGRFTVTGIDIKSAKKTKQKYLKILSETGLDTNRIDLHIMSYPFAKIVNLSLKSLWSKIKKADTSGILKDIKNLKLAPRAALNKLAYDTLPSKVRHGQRIYFKQKVLKSLITTAIVESLGLTLTVISPHFSSVEKVALVSANLSLFYLYAKYKDSWLNWLFNPGTNKVLGFAKQISLSIPYIASFMLFGQLDSVIDFVQMNGIAEALSNLFQTQLGQIAIGAAPTAIPAALWHRFFNTDTLARWYNSKKSLSIKEQLKAFTTMENIMKPTGFIFSGFFVLAAMPGAAKILELGSMGSYNFGQVAMVSFTALMIGTFKFFPKLLDKINEAPSLIKIIKGWRRKLRAN